MSRSAYGRRSGADSTGDGAFGRSHQPLWGRILYRVLWSMVLALCKVLFRLRVEGKENFPPGPFILSPVHRSFIDTPIAGMATSRRLRFMGKESLWENRPLGAFLTVLGGFPVERGTADRTALRAATDVLALGEPLVMFPEGTRRTGDRVRRDDMLDGPAFVAAPRRRTDRSRRARRHRPSPSSGFVRAASPPGGRRCRRTHTASRQGRRAGAAPGRGRGH